MDLDQSNVMRGGNSSTADVSGKQTESISENDLNINSQFHLENQIVTKILSEWREKDLSFTLLYTKQ